MFERCRVTTHRHVAGQLLCGGIDASLQSRSCLMVSPDLRQAPADRFDRQHRRPASVNHCIDALLSGRSIAAATSPQPQSKRRT
jgi:hypothetical protein